MSDEEKDVWLDVPPADAGAVVSVPEPDDPPAPDDDDED